MSTSEEAVTRSRWRLALTGVFLAALGLRLVYLQQLAGSLLGQVLLGDGVAYDAWARRLAAGDWWGSEVFYQAPLYPYVMATLYAAIAPDPLWPRLLQALLGATSCVLLAAAGRQLFGARPGLWAGVLLAAYPPAIFFDGEIQKASLSLFFATLLLWLTARWGELPGLGWVVAAGAVTGLFALNRENALLLIPLLAAWLLAATGGGWRRRSLAAGLLVAGALGVLLPVALRNRAIGGELLLTTAQLGPNFYIGNHPGADGRYQPLRPARGSARYEREDATTLAEAAAGRELTPAEVSHHWLDRGLAFVSAEPGRWLRLTARKWFLVWNRLEIVDTTSLEAAADASPLLRMLAAGLHFGVLCPLAVFGGWLTRRRWRQLGLLYLMLVGWALAVTAFFVFARYRVPMVPILALFAGAGVAWAAVAARQRRWRELLPAAALAVLTAVFVNWPADPRDPRVPTYASLGTALAEAGRNAEGLAMFERAVALSPGFAEAQVALGDLRLEGGDLAGAEAAYRRAVAEAPGSAAAWNALGVLVIRQGNRDEALRCFQRAVAAEGDHAPARYNLARALFAAGDLTAAREQYTRLVALEPADVEARHELANLLAHGGELAAAAREYERVVTRQPGHADAHFKLALVRERLGDAAAVGDLRRALALEPRYGERLLATGLSAEAAGRPADAERLYRLLVAAADGHHEAQERLVAIGRRR